MKQQKEDIQILLNAYHLIPQDIMIKQTTNIEVNKNKFTSIKTFSSSDRFHIDKLDQFSKFQTLINEQVEQSAQKVEMHKQLNNLLNILKPVYQDGDEFQGIQGIEKFVIDGQQAYLTDCEYKPKRGQVTLISFYSGSNKYIIQTMIYHLEILEAYPDWRDKVRVVGISMDVDSSVFKKTILERKWENEEQYRIKDKYAANNAYLKPLQMREIPYIILLNKANQIIYRGNQANIILEEKIKELIEENIGPNEKKQQDPKDVGKQFQEQNEIILEKEQFKLLKYIAKTQIFEYFKTLNDDRVQINVSAVKQNLIQRDGSKVAIARTPLKLSYNINTESKGKIDYFQKQIWETLPENHRVLGELIVIDEETIEQQLKLNFQEIGALFGINLQFSTVITTNFCFNNLKLKFDQEKDQKKICKVENISVDNFQNFFETQFNFMSSLNRIFSDIASSISFQILNGLQYHNDSQFDPIASYHKLYNDYETIYHKKGQVLLIYHWDDWFQDCEPEMKKITKILNKNKKKWQDSVRFVFLSKNIAEDCIQFIERIQEYENNIDFYFPKQISDLPLRKYMLRLSYLVFDKVGKIRYRLQNIKLTQKINKLLAEQEIKQLEEDQLTQLSQESQTELCNFLNSKQIQQFTKDLGGSNIFDFSVKIVESSFLGGKTTKLLISYFVRQKKQEKFNIFLNKVLSFIPENSYEIKGVISKTIDIPFPGIECVLCNKALNDQVQQYYSPYKNEFFCCECAEYDDKTQKGLHRFKCTDNLIFINAPLNDKSVLFDIDDYKIGKNQKLAPGKKGSQYHEINCDGNHVYQGMEVGPRYISLNAKPGKLRDDVIYSKIYLELC